MKSFSHLLLIPFTLIIFFSVFSGFTPASDTMLVEELVHRRAEILQAVFFREMEPEKGEQLLYEILTQPLLASDVRNIRNSTDTDLDSVKDMEILMLEQTSGLYGNKSYRGQILWHMKGANGEYIQTVEYIIVLKKSLGEYKLSEFSPVER